VFLWLSLCKRKNIRGAIGRPLPFSLWCRKFLTLLVVLNTAGAALALLIKECWYLPSAFDFNGFKSQLFNENT
jgi:hypothetical protein